MVVTSGLRVYQLMSHSHCARKLSLFSSHWRSWISSAVSIFVVALSPAILGTCRAMLRAKTAPPRRAGSARSLAPTLNGLRIVRCGGNAVVEKATTGSTRTAMAAAEQISVDTHLFMLEPQQRLLRLFVGFIITYWTVLGPSQSSAQADIVWRW